MEPHDEDALRRAQADLKAHRPHGPELKAELDRAFSKIRPQVLRLCRRLFRNDADAEEATQSAIAISLEKLRDYGFDGSFAGFVCGVARNVHRNKLKKFTEVLTDDGVVDIASNDIGGLAALRESEREDLFEEACGRLPDADQAVLNLYRLGWSYAEIDAELGLEGSGARAALMKARRHLGETIREELERRGHGTSFFWTTVP